MTRAPEFHSIQRSSSSRGAQHQVTNVMDNARNFTFWSHFPLVIVTVSGCAFQYFGYFLVHPLRWARSATYPHYATTIITTLTITTKQKARLSTHVSLSTTNDRMGSPTHSWRWIHSVVRIHVVLSARHDDDNESRTRHGAKRIQPL